MTVRGAVAVALGLRVLLVALGWYARGPAAFAAPDSQGYLASATALADTFEFNDALGRPELFRTPGYPLLLAPGILTGRPLIFAIGVQLLLSAALVLLTYSAANRLLKNDSAAVICAVLAAVEPTTLLWSVKVMPETLFTVATVAFSAAALRGLESPKWLWTAVAGAWLSLAAYIKPIAYPLVLLTLVALLIPWRGTSLRSYRHAGVFAAVCVLLLGPWHLRNARVAGYSGFSTLTDYALYVSVGGSIVAGGDGRAYMDVRKERLAATSAGSAAGGGPKYADMRREGLALLRSNWIAYARTHGQGMMRTVFDPGAVEYLRLFGRYPEAGGGLARIVDLGPVRGVHDLAVRRPSAFWLSVAMALLLMPLLILPLTAIARVPPAARAGWCLLASLALYFIVAGGGVPGSSRFRVPAVPFLILLSGFTLRVREERSAVAAAGTGG